MPILPTIIATITRKPRYIPKPDKDKGKLLVNDIFRWYESVFGRRYGIRAESSTQMVKRDGKWIQKYEFYTIEAFLTHIECLIREWVKKPKFEIKWVSLPVFQPAGLLPQHGGVRIPIFTLAVAFTSFDGNGFTASGTTCTTTLTTSGSDRAAMGIIWTWNAADSYTSTTYAGATMSELSNRSADGSGSVIRITGKHNATTGSNTLQSNTSGSMQHIISGAAYSGVDTSSAAAAFPDSDVGSGSATNGTTSSTTATGTITLTVADSWPILHARVPTKAATAGTSTTKRGSAAISGDSNQTFDSNAARSTGSNDLVYEWVGTTTTYWCMTSMAPVSSPVVSTSTAKKHLLSLMGVG